MSEESTVSRRRRRSRSKKRSAQYWMLVVSPGNFRQTVEQGFTVQGIQSRHRRRAEALREGDRLLFYATGRMAFAATCTLTSAFFEDHTPIWRSVRPQEDYPWRVRIRPDQVLEAQEWIPARELAYRMEYVRHWAPESWPLAFQGHIHQLAKVDFKLVENELRRSLRGRGKREENSNGRGNTLPEPTEELAPQAAELGGIGSMAGG